MVIGSLQIMGSDWTIKPSRDWAKKAVLILGKSTKESTQSVTRAFAERWAAGFVPPIPITNDQAWEQDAVRQQAWPHEESFVRLFLGLLTALSICSNTPDAIRSLDSQFTTTQTSPRRIQWVHLQCNRPKYLHSLRLPWRTLFPDERRGQEQSIIRIQSVSYTSYADGCTEN